MGVLVLVLLSLAFYAKLRKRRKESNRAPDEIYPLW